MAETHAAEQDAIAVDGAGDDETEADPWEGIELEEYTFTAAEVEVIDSPQSQSLRELEGDTWPEASLILLSELISALYGRGMAEILDKVSEAEGILQEDGANNFASLIISPERLDYSSLVRIFPENLPKGRLQRQLVAGLRQVANGDLEAVWIGSETAFLILRKA